MKTRIIGLMGAKQSGKDTVASFIATEFFASRIGFADALKKLCSEMFNIPVEYFHDPDRKDDYSTLPKLRCPFCEGKEVERLSCENIENHVKYGSFWTYREILQHIGTEGFRYVDPEVWVRKVEIEIQKMSFAVITDVRFRSEANMIWKNGGEVWRIRRPGKSGDGHASEQGDLYVKDSEVQTIINNDGTLHELKKVVISRVKAGTR